MPNRRSQEQAEVYSAQDFIDGMFQFQGYPVYYDPIPAEIPAEIPVEIPDEIYTELFKKCSQLRSEILDHISGDETLEIYQKVQSFLLTERTFEKDIIGIMFDDIELEEGENNFIVTKLLQAYIIGLDLKSHEDVERILGLKLGEGVVFEPNINQPPVFTTESTPAPVVREATQKSCWQRFTDLFQCC